ncbi:PilZ domain-containing protein [Thermodesulfobacteriota bacterium]
MSQIFGIEFVDLEDSERQQIVQYVNKCLGKTDLNSPYATAGIDGGPSQYRRTRPAQSDVVRIAMQFSIKDEKPIVEEVVDLSGGGVRCLCRRDHPLEVGENVEWLMVLLPDLTIRCKGRVVWTSSDED